MIHEGLSVREAAKAEGGQPKNRLQATPALPQRGRSGLAGRSFRSHRSLKRAAEELARQVWYGS